MKAKPRPDLLYPRSSSFSIQALPGRKGRAKLRKDDRVLFVYRETFDFHKDLAERFKNSREHLKAVLPKARVVWGRTVVGFDIEFSRAEAASFIVGEYLAQSQFGQTTFEELYTDVIRGKMLAQRIANTPSVPAKPVASRRRK